ncbi:ATP-dependent helicase [Candidatus Dojkabacteria bacterium]|nr:ATP-dependent helicase [Candidatus Dojkabacteria bacterium]
MEKTLKINKNQQAAIAHIDGPALVIAGAGTGKTFVITQRIVSLIKTKKALPSEILALTFTNKAASEMAERVDQALPLGTFTEWIMTFHTFCEKILKQNAVHFDLEPSFRLINKREAIHLFKEYIRAFSLDRYRPSGNKYKYVSDILSFFSRVQDEAYSAQEFFNYVTKSLLSFLKKHGLSESQFKNLLDKNQVKTTIDSFVYTVSNPKKIPSWKNLANIYPKVEEIPEDVSAEFNTLAGNFELARVFVEFESVKNELNLLDFGDMVQKTIELFKKRPAILKKYQQLFKYILVDEFQDTNYAQYALLKLLAHPNNNLMVVGDDDQSIYKFRGASISNILTFQKDFPKTEVYVLVDNYRSTQPILNLAYQSIQNNNPDRLEIKTKISKLLKAQGNELDTEINVTVSETGYDEAEWIAREISKLTGIKLSKLYSDSKPNSVEIVISEPKKETEPGQLTLIQENEASKNIALSDISILARSLNHVNQITEVFSKAGIPYNLAQGKNLLTEDEVLFILSFLRVLTDYTDDLSMLYLLRHKYNQLNPRDFMLINQKAKYSKETVLLWIERNLGLSLDNPEAKPVLSPEIINLHIKDDSIEKITKIFNLIAESLKLVRDQKDLTFIVYNTLSKLDVLINLTKEDNISAKIEINNIERILNIIKTFSLKFGTTNPDDFVRYIDSIKFSGEPPEDEEEFSSVDAVNILTVHKAKGLEFDTVFLVGLAGRRFPSDDRKDPIDLPSHIIHEILPEGDFHIQEERRLFYVALTRAKRRLFLSFAQKYNDGKQIKKPSVFLAELGINASATPKPDLNRDKLSEIMIDSSLTPDNKAIPFWEPKVSTLSYSQLNSYESCPYQYKLRYILKLPSKQSATFFYGSIIHELLKHMFLYLKQNNKQLPIENALAFIDNSWDPSPFDTKEESEAQKQTAKKTVQNFYAKHYESKGSLVVIEDTFKVLLKDIVLTGRIDRVDKTNDNKFRIIDYKTGNLKDIADVKNDMQLKIYAYAFTQKFMSKVDEISLFFVDHGKDQLIKLPEGYYDKLENELWEKIGPAVEKINSKQFTANPSPLCRFCEYRNVCEFAMT